MAVLGILSGCRSSRDLEAFARRHGQVLIQKLGLDFKRWLPGVNNVGGRLPNCRQTRWPSEATFLYLFNKAHLQAFGQVLQTWMIGKIPGVAGGA